MKENCRHFKLPPERGCVLVCLVIASPAQPGVASNRFDKLKASSLPRGWMDCFDVRFADSSQ